jgi:hypothetical protein
MFNVAAAHDQSGDSETPTTNQRSSLYKIAEIEKEKEKGEDTHDSIIEHLYTDMIKSICIDVACVVHRMAKTGGIPISEMAAINQNEDNENSSSRNKKRRLGNQNGTGNDSTKCGGYTIIQPSEMRLRTRGASSGVDAWNRIAPPDVLTTCKNCRKVLSATRFASHLDKCLGRLTSRSRSSSC